MPSVPDNAPGVLAIHAASGAGYGEGFAANAHRHAPDAWVSTVTFLVEELKADVNARDFKGFHGLTGIRRPHYRTPLTVDHLESLDQIFDIHQSTRTEFGVE